MVFQFVDECIGLSSNENNVVLWYDTRSDQWSYLPHCPVKYFGLGQLSGKLIAVSGMWAGDATDVYVFEEETQQWEKSIPPISECFPMCVVSYHSKIVVFCHNRQEVWVFNGETSQWYTAAPLPFT